MPTRTQSPETLGVIIKKPSLRMKITRKDLIQLCDRFLRDEIGKSEIEIFSWTLISSDDEEWRKDEIVSETIFEWDNEEMDFPINKVNMQLWKDRLLTNIDKLVEYNNWNFYIEKQQEVCKKYNSNWVPINKNLKVGASDNLTTDPLNALRHPSEHGTTGWFIWSGDYSTADDFLKPICAEHLLQVRPQIIKYLGLDIGYRFIIDNRGYEDIWYDDTLKIV